ncbi:MAG: penicillin-binding protein 2 [Opitutaceae bacterium]|nr:penicillin-binding protein 2 [Cytophagales bacterium]
MLEQRKYIIQIIIVAVGVIYLLKLLWLQTIDQTYKDSAMQNSIQRITVYPYRGVIFDRKGEMLVANSPVFDIMVIPKDVKIPDTVTFSNTFGLTVEEVRLRLREARRYSKVKPSVFMPTLSTQDWARVQDKIVDYPGFYVQARSVRDYPFKCMANALGYIGEVSKERIELLGKDNYKSGDYIGISGIEEIYEKQLRGKRGVRYVMVDVKGAEKGEFKNGEYDTLSVAGENMTSTVDVKLQAYGEQIMQGKIGSIVAIEPATGEILCLISAPTYDPNLLVGKQFSKNYNLLSKNYYKPLYNRALQAMYPPGSTFKIIQSLIGLQDHLIDSSRSLPCNKGLINCHNHPPAIGMRGAIQHSCNPYFYVLYNTMLQRGLSPNAYVDAAKGFDIWYDYVKSFNLGTKLGVDLPNEKSGRVPTHAFYDKVYGDNRWAFKTIFSLGIGQGEILVVPLQMANVAATLANRGYYHIPHIIKKIGDKNMVDAKYLKKNYTKIDPANFTTVTNGMFDVVDFGTAYRSHIEGIPYCGKTGTAQNPHGEDHSVFMAFAPRYNPKIAIAVYVENAGFGDKWAAPIASLMIEKYLSDTITRKDIEQKMQAKNFIKYNEALASVLLKREGLDSNYANVKLVLRKYFKEKMSKTRKH